MRALLLVFVAASAGCLRSTQFQCATDADCGANGVCEAVKFCSFPDDACGGRRFGDSAGPYANQCTTASSMMPDAGNQMGSDSSTPPTDGSQSVGCPAGYNVVGTLPHKYKVLTVPNDWQTQVTACNATSPSSAYLFIPDDATELAAIDAIAGAQYWVGIDDLQTVNTFVNVKNLPQTFLPWDTGAGEPNNGPPPEQCVDAHKANNLIYTDKCSNKYPAVCECDP